MFQRSGQSIGLSELFGMAKIVNICIVGNFYLNKIVFYFKNDIKGCENKRKGLLKEESDPRAADVVCRTVRGFGEKAAEGECLLPCPVSANKKYPAVFRPPDFR